MFCFAVGIEKITWPVSIRSLSFLPDLLHRQSHIFFRGLVGRTNRTWDTKETFSLCIVKVGIPGQVSGVECLKSKMCFSRMREMFYKLTSHTFDSATHTWIWWRSIPVWVYPWESFTSPISSGFSSPLRKWPAVYLQRKWCWALQPLVGGRVSWQHWAG